MLPRNKATKTKLHCNGKQRTKNINDQENAEHTIKIFKIKYGEEKTGKKTKKREKRATDNLRSQRNVMKAKR